MPQPSGNLHPILRGTPRYPSDKDSLYVGGGAGTTGGGVVFAGHVTGPKALNRSTRKRTPKKLRHQQASARARRIRRLRAAARSTLLANPPAEVLDLAERVGMDLALDLVGPKGWSHDWVPGSPEALAEKLHWNEEKGGSARAAAALHGKGELSGPEAKIVRAVGHHPDHYVQGHKEGADEGLKMVAERKGLDPEAVKAAAKAMEDRANAQLAKQDERKAEVADAKRAGASPEKIEELKARQAHEMMRGDNPAVQQKQEKRAADWNRRQAEKLARRNERAQAEALGVKGPIRHGGKPPAEAPANRVERRAAQHEAQAARHIDRAQKARRAGRHSEAVRHEQAAARSVGRAHGLRAFVRYLRESYRAGRQIRKRGGTIRQQMAAGREIGRKYVKLADTGGRMLDLAGPKGYIHGWIKVGAGEAALNDHLRQHHGYDNPTAAGRAAHAVGMKMQPNGEHQHERSSYHPLKARAGDASPQTEPEKFTDDALRAEIKHLMKLNKRFGSHPLRTAAYLKLLGELKKRGAGAAKLSGNSAASIDLQAGTMQVASTTDGPTSTRKTGMGYLVNHVRSSKTHGTRIPRGTTAVGLGKLHRALHRKGANHTHKQGALVGGTQQVTGKEGEGTKAPATGARKNQGQAALRLGGTYETWGRALDLASNVLSEQPLGRASALSSTSPGTNVPMTTGSAMLNHLGKAHGVQLTAAALNGADGGAAFRLHRQAHLLGLFPSGQHEHPGADLAGTGGNAIDLAVLKAAQRKKVPSSKFGLPSEGKYPMPDKSHAANAKSRAAQQLKKGRLSRGQYQSIVAKANRILGSKAA